MADWSKPDLLSTESEYTDEIKARDEDLAKQFDGTTSTNLPDGTIRWNSVNKFWEKLISGVWQALCDVYNIVVSRAQQADNADTLDGLDSSQFLRSDEDDSFSGTLTSTMTSGVPIKLDDGDVRITIHDGYGNFNIKLHATESETYEETGSGAAAIKLNASLDDGNILLLVAPIGTAGDTISWASQLKIDCSGAYFNNNPVWHAGNDGPGSGLEADLLDGAHATATPTPGAIPIADSTGKLAMGWIPDTIPTGTRMLFGSVPPAGWVLVTDFHDRVLRIVNDSTLVGLTGGSWTITGMVSAGGHTHTIAAGGAHTHSISADGSHQHECPVTGYNTTADPDTGWIRVDNLFGLGSVRHFHTAYENFVAYPYAGAGDSLDIANAVDRETLLTSSSGGHDHGGATGSAGSHDHGGATGSAGDHTHTFDGTWRPAYLNLVMAEKA